MNQKNDDENRKIKDHNYDGIEELDYGPPVWFQALFLITVVFGLGYFFYYSLGTGLSQKEEYESERRVDEITLLANQAKSGGSSLSENDLKALLKDTQRKAAGNQIFQSKCASCHGAQGQGGIGPNLTDPNWIHGGKLTEIYATIEKGVLDKGMPPWGAILKADELQSTVVFIRSLSGSNPPNAKAPQGELVRLE